MKSCPVLLLFGTALPTPAARRAIWDNGGTVTLHHNEFKRRTGCKDPVDAKYHGLCVAQFRWLHGCNIGHELGFRSVPLIQLKDGTWLMRRAPKGVVDICDPNEEFVRWMEARRALEAAGGNALCEHFDDPPPFQSCPFQDEHDCPGKH